MQLISEPNQKLSLGAAAAFETLGAVNSSLSVVRTKDYNSSGICEVRRTNRGQIWSLSVDMVSAQRSLLLVLPFSQRE